MLTIPNDLFIWVVAPPGYPHYKAFIEVAESLAAGFRNIGAHTPLHYGMNPLRGTPIVIGCNLLPPNYINSLPKNTIIYNLEQISKDSPWANSNYLRFLQKYRVIDYSKTNISNLEKIGFSAAHHLPISYAKELERIPSRTKEIDALFIGSMNQRRKKILSDVAACGLNVHAAFNIYGAERDELMAKSRIILNIHFYEAKVFEIVRVSYALANQGFVISERGADEELEIKFANGIAWGDYEEIPKLCKYYIKNESERADVASTGQQIFREMRIEDALLKIFASESTRI